MPFSRIASQQQWKPLTLEAPYRGGKGVRKNKKTETHKEIECSVKDLNIQPPNLHSITPGIACPSERNPDHGQGSPHNVKDCRWNFWMSPDVSNKKQRSGNGILHESMKTERLKRESKEAG